MGLRDHWKKNRVKVVWTITFASVFFWLLGGEILHVKLPFGEFLNRSWHSFKQAQQRKFREKTFRADAKISLLQLEYSNRVDFWFDEKIKKELSAFLETYPDPVLLNMDPVHLLKDPVLKSILQNPQIVRPFRVEPTSPLGENLDLERAVASNIEQVASAEQSSADCLKSGDVSKCFSLGMKVLPEEPTYFLKGHLWGFSALGRSASRSALESNVSINAIGELPLTLTGAKFELPTSLLSILSLSLSCQSYRYTLNSEIVFDECRGDRPANIHLENPLPLYFYNKNQFRYVTLSKAKDITGTLIIEAVDSASYFANIHGEKYTMGELVATGLSNILKGHTAVRDLKIIWGERILFLFALLILITFYRRAVLNTYIEVFAGGIVSLLIIDLALCVFLNARTEPMNHILALSLVGFVGFGVLSKREYERRSLIEKALSGYVSPERLRRLVSGEEKLGLFGQRKELTTILLDIVGFSLLSKELEIARVFQFIQKFFGTIDPIVFKNRGVIDKKTGDGMLAFCGDSDGMTPREAALSAVQTAYEIQEELSKLPDDYFGVNHPIRARIGVNTGEMMIGNAGSERHFNYTVLGDAVNFTQRLEAACPEGSVLIGEQTAIHVKDKWKLEKIEIMIKHEDKPVQAFKLLGPI